MNQRFQRAPRRASPNSMIGLSDAQRAAQIDTARRAMADDGDTMLVEKGDYELPEPITHATAAPGALDWANAGAGPDEEPMATLEALAHDPAVVAEAAAMAEEAPANPTLTADLGQISAGRVTISGLPWNLDMAEAPDDGTIVIAMGRFADARAGYPRFVRWLENAWRESGRTISEPLVCWAWMPREVLGAWPAEPK